MASNYDPTSWMMRKLLADEILIKLHDCGFVEELPDPAMAFKAGRQWGHKYGRMLGPRERVFTRDVNDQIKLKVYTSIVGDEVRDTGKDAIKVCAIYTAKDGSTRGLVKNRRVHRTGNVREIADRMHQRMRDTWRDTMNGQKCSKCGAPMFISKKKNLVCAEVCWKTR